MARELLGTGALKAVDGLLLVAHREDGAALLAGAPAAEEVSGEADDHVPLLGAGVLGLVHEHVIEAAVELVVDPRHPRLRREQPPRPLDQVVVVEQRPFPFHRLVSVEQREADAEQRPGRCRHVHRLQPLEAGVDAGPLLDEDAERLRIRHPRGPAHQGGIAARRPVPPQEDGGVSAGQGLGTPSLVGEPGADRERPLPVRPGPALKGALGPAERPGVHPAGNVGGH